MFFQEVLDRAQRASLCQLLGADEGSAMKVHPPSQPETSIHRFESIVCLKLEREWCYVESAEQALECLDSRFEDHADPSWQRAHATCAAFIEGKMGSEAAKSAFIVAAMAAGIAFEVAESSEEQQLEEAASEELMAVLLDDPGAP